MSQHRKGRGRLWETGVHPHRPHCLTTQANRSKLIWYSEKTGNGCEKEHADFFFFFLIKGTENINGCSSGQEGGCSAEKYVICTKDSRKAGVPGYGLR